RGSKPLPRTMFSPIMRRFIAPIYIAACLSFAHSGWALIPNLPAGTVTSRLTVVTRLGENEKGIRYAPKPLVPRFAPRRSARGVFIVDINVATGFALNVRILQSTGSDELDNAAIAALRQWQFQPRAFYKVTVPIEFSSSGRI